MPAPRTNALLERHEPSPGSTPTRSEPVVVARSVSKVFESGDGLRALDLEVPAGTIVGFVGPSGSGKTTAVRLMTGGLAPTDGSLRVFDTKPTSFDAAVRQRIGYMPQHSVLYPNLSVIENLHFFASLYGKAWVDAQTLHEALDFVELTGHETKRVLDISGGMKRRLALAATLIHEPDLMFLDEPTAGIDPLLRRKFWDRFTTLKGDDKTLIVTTQYVGEAAYCDYVAVLADGELLLVETPEGLRRAAFGGDVINVEFEHRPPGDLVADLAVVAGATEHEFYSARGLSLVVDEAAVSLPKLSAWLVERDIPIVQAEEILPPFDDVFVELVNGYRGSGSAADPIGAVAGNA